MPLLAAIVDHVAHVAKARARRIEAAEQVIIFAERGEADPARPGHGGLPGRLPHSVIAAPVSAVFPVAEDLLGGLDYAAGIEDVEAEYVVVVAREMP